MLKDYINPFPWKKYSRKLIEKIKNPRAVGIFTPKGAAERGMHLAVGTEGNINDGNIVTLYWLVDPQDGVIVDVKFQVFGQSALVGAAEAVSELLVGKNYDQAHRISADLIDKSLRDKSEVPSFPAETYPHLNLVLSAIDEAYEQCTEIPLAETYVAPPMTSDLSEVVEGGYPGWMDMSDQGKISVLEQVFDQDIRPYIALDAGGVEILRIEQGVHIVIKYQGSCTSCISSVGATLSYIQQILKNKVCQDIKVIPEM